MTNLPEGLGKRGSDLKLLGSSRHLRAGMREAIDDPHQLPSVGGHDRGQASGSLEHGAANFQHTTVLSGIVVKHHAPHQWVVGVNQFLRSGSVGIKPLLDANGFDGQPVVQVELRKVRSCVKRGHGID